MDLQHLAQTVFVFIAALCGLCAAAGIAYTVSASLLVGRFFGRCASVPKNYPGITVVKPLHGDEWHLLEHLASFLEQDYPGPIHYLFGVHDPEDAALRAVDALCVRYPEARITIVVDARLYGPNRKIANLVNMLERAEYDIFCLADSDVRVDRSYLRHTVGALQQPGVGLVTSAFRGLYAPGFWPRVAAASTNYHFLPSVITGLAIGRARPCFGQSIAVTRATLLRIGGLTQFAHHLAEDYAIGEAVRESGLSVAIAPFVVQHACVEDTFGKLFAHELRWSRTIRAADRAGHLGSVLMHPFPLALLAIMFSGGQAATCALAALSLAVRAMLICLTDRATGQLCEGLWYMPLCDVVQFMIYIASFFTSRVVWRGRRFRVDDNGMLAPVHQE
ncbi:bacteriohopanetetrol glucosamine biosynthesis glycosyltransferase HpnI [Caballeronia humi]|uniref:Acyl-CoA dehydrogenase-like protein n=1 Tax=Caballeronia humi TaxID=326474 RepID=A0A158J7P9_9BURK|nr:bacteriohopanetetrol glucosamine biosynthesis glycosyltransferase HpnI [Caballeronia humi]SAL64856.1 Acyl-CoA dehydrogenase-like protein [Caballeronia humi]